MIIGFLGDLEVIIWQLQPIDEVVHPLIAVMVDPVNPNLLPGCHACNWLQTYSGNRAVEADQRVFRSAYQNAVGRDMLQVMLSGTHHRFSLECIRPFSQKE